MKRSIAISTLFGLAAMWVSLSSQAQPLPLDPVVRIAWVGDVMLADGPGR